jgi:hypothetical protein
LVWYWKLAAAAGSILILLGILGAPGGNRGDIGPIEIGLELISA